ncbi:MAG TPA: hypothetical protein VG223_04145, partial [Solirubrobacteraceae bacterium]|nr:hypothetical protein [Solirubrobacteraceae bacterium]
TALDYLKHNKQPGGVLSRAFLGVTVPGRTGRQTYIGDCLWSEPNCSRRSQITNQLFFGQLRPWVARQFVAGTGARFVLADCETASRVGHELKSIVHDVRHFGCATVSEVDTRVAPASALAESPPHGAPVRTSRRG